MKVRVLRNRRGNAVASILQTSEDPNLVPLDAEVEDEGEVEELEIRQRDLLDLDALHKRLNKK